MYKIYVYKNDPYEFIETFDLKSESYLEALVDAANEVRKRYTNARVGKVEKIGK